MSIRHEAQCDNCWVWAPAKENLGYGGTYYQYPEDWIEVSKGPLTRVHVCSRDCAIELLSKDCK